LISSEYRLKLELKPEIASVYRSLSQRARVLTENWVQENLYCPACAYDGLYPTPTGRQVVDFACPDCQEIYQLKSQSHPYGYQVMNRLRQQVE
jgi:transposase-like protein